nr:MAG TPA: hypothetical protein [Caudoviricetes sp.]
MAQFKIVNSNKNLLSYIQEKAQEEFGATVTAEENAVTIECEDEVVDDILTAYKMAKVKYTATGLLNWGGKKVGFVAGITKDAGIGSIKIASKGLFGGLKKVAELGIGGVSVITDEAKASWSELSKSDEIRSIKKSFGSTGDGSEDIVMVSNQTQATEEAQG